MLWSTVIRNFLCTHRDHHLLTTDITHVAGEVENERSVYIMTFGSSIKPFSL